MPAHPLPKTTVHAMIGAYEHERAERGVRFGECFCGCRERAPRAAKTDVRSGLLKGRPCRFVVGHNRRKRPYSYTWVIEDRGHDTPCWIWQGPYHDEGYGQLHVRGRTVTAHRHNYVTTIGPVPNGHELHHECEVRACCNPSHLVPLTRAEHNRVPKKAIA